MSPTARRTLDRIPEVTPGVGIVTVLATTGGETAGALATDAA